MRCSEFAKSDDLQQEDPWMDHIKIISNFFFGFAIPEDIEQETRQLLRDILSVETIPLEHDWADEET